MEPRARAGRHKSSLNFGKELTNFLYAYGAPTHPDLLDPQPDSAHYLNRVPTDNTSHRPTSFNHPFPETLRVLDEIVTDFIIETCHEAVSHAALVGRQKLTVHDFKFVIHKDRAKLGRVQTLMATGVRMGKERKLGLTEMDGPPGRMKVDALMTLGDFAGEEGTGKGKGRGRGRRRKRKAQSQEPEGGSEKDDDDDDGRSERSRSVKRVRSDLG